LITSIGRSLTARPILASHRSENAVLGGLQLYDRTKERLTQDEVERIRF
jgi:hypothetical protein